MSLLLLSEKSKRSVLPPELARVVILNLFYKLLVELGYISYICLYVIGKVDDILSIYTISVLVS